MQGRVKSKKDIKLCLNNLRNITSVKGCASFHITANIPRYFRELFTQIRNERIGQTRRRAHREHQMIVYISIGKTRNCKLVRDGAYNMQFHLRVGLSNCPFDCLSVCVHLSIYDRVCSTYLSNSFCSLTSPSPHRKVVTLIQ